MSDRIMLPLPDGRWLSLSPETFEAALAEGRAAVGATAPTGDAETLMGAEELAAVLDLPLTWVEQKAREGKIPCIRAGRYVRFRRSAVEAALVAQTDNH